MNIDPDGRHEILRLFPKTDEERARFVPLSDEDAATLQSATPEERREWIRQNIPTKERLARHLAWIGIPVLAARARSGEFSDFDEGSPHAMPKVVLLQELRRQYLKACRKKGEHSDKAFRISDLEKHVKAGEYDDTKAEGDAWAARQTGEVRAILDRMEESAAPREAEGGEGEA